MRVIFVATASVALALEGAVHADSDEYLSLLQLSARPRSVAEDLDVVDVDDLDSAGQGPGQGSEEIIPITWDTQRSFGPDGTWATPFCPHVEGCLLAERVCPAGCDGTAWWQAGFNRRKEGFGALPASRKPLQLAHFHGCEQGKTYGGAFGSSIVLASGSALQNCKNGPDSKKPAVFDNSAGKESLLKWKRNIGMSFPSDLTMTAYMNEYCPAGCVNDCAVFNMGNFYTCGSLIKHPSQYYNHQVPSPASRVPNPKCPLGSIFRRGESTATWCGEPTTTTTTPPPPPVEEPVDEPAGDEADATGDPHMTTNTGQRFDLQ